MLKESMWLQEPSLPMGSMVLEPMALPAQRQAGVEPMAWDRPTYHAVEDERSARTMWTAAAEYIRRS